MSIIYSSLKDFARKRLRGVYQSGSRDYWCNIISRRSPRSEKDISALFQLFDATSNWLCHIVPVVEKELHFANSLPAKIYINIQPDFDNPELSVISYDNLAGKIISSIDSQGMIQLILPDYFFTCLNTPDNRAERSLIKAIINGLSLIAGIKNLDNIEDLIEKIIPNKYFKYLHAFKTFKYVAYFQSILPKIIFIDKIDHANNLLMLGLIDNKKRVISGKKDCTEFFNKLMGILCEKISQYLGKIDRKSIVTKLLINLCSVNSERFRWKNTAASMLAIYTDEKKTLKIIHSVYGNFNSANIGSRLLIEMANCTCPECGIEAEELDLSKLMSYAILMYEFGGWSDAINNDILSPKINISPYGNIMIDADYLDNIIDLYGAETNNTLIKKDANRYESLFSNYETEATTSPEIENDFLSAWEEFWGISLDKTTQCIDVLKELGINENKIVLDFSKSDFISILETKVAKNSAIAFIDSFSLPFRRIWYKVPDGYLKHDWQPWRFRRMLSLVSKPIVMLNEDSYLVSPTQLEDSFAYLLNNLYFGHFDEKHFSRSPQMLSWNGRKNNEMGHLFNKKVSKKLHELGWITVSDIELTEILKKSLDKSYGDIDVLAWHHAKRRILVIECKDLIFAKTHGEITRQIQEFRGFDVEGQPDRLKKHLNRFKCLEESFKDLLKYIGGDENFSLECHLVFSNTVPVFYSKSKGLENVMVSCWEQLDNI